MILALAVRKRNIKNAVEEINKVKIIKECKYK